MNAADYAQCAELLSDPDSEDNERFASRYGRHLLEVAQDATEALRDLIALIGEVAPAYSESPVVANARAALAVAEL